MSNYFRSIALFNFSSHIHFYADVSAAGTGGSQWVIQTVDSAGDVGEWCSLA